MMNTVDRLAEYPFVDTRNLECIRYDWGTLFVSAVAKDSLPKLDCRPNAKDNVLVVIGAFRGQIMIQGSNNLCILGGDDHKSSLLNLYFWGKNSVFSFGRRSTSNGFSAEFVNNDHVSVGEDCMFAAEIVLRTTDRHAIVDRSGEVINRPKPIRIADHVWIAQRVIVMKGVEVGNGAILATGAVVTKSVPSGVIVAGNPAKIVRRDVTWTRSPAPNADESAKALAFLDPPTPQ